MFDRKLIKQTNNHHQLSNNFVTLLLSANYLARIVCLEQGLCGNPLDEILLGEERQPHVFHQHWQELGPVCVCDSQEFKANVNLFCVLVSVCEYTCVCV